MMFSRDAKSDLHNPGSAIDDRRWAAIRLFAMDVDGVLTDGTVQISSDGTEAKGFSILDGHGLRMLEKAGVQTAWITGRPSLATALRATELKIPHLVQGRVDKLEALQELARRLKIRPEECAYMGDDTIDAPAIEWAGIGIAPREGMPEVLAIADYITHRGAGHGAVREVCDLILASRRNSTVTRKRRSHGRNSATTPGRREKGAGKTKR